MPSKLNDGSYAVMVRFPNRESALLAMRQDLKRVAKRQGLEDGFAPSGRYYRRHGNFSSKSIQTAILGHENTTRWVECMKELNLKPSHLGVKRWRFDEIQALVNQARGEFNVPFGVAPTHKQYQAFIKKHDINLSWYRVMTHAGTESWPEAMRYFGFIPVSEAGRTKAKQYAASKRAVYESLDAEARHGHSMKYRTFVKDEAA